MTQFGVIADILWSYEKIMRYAKLAEKYGYDHIWISDHPLGFNPFVVLTAAAHVTKQVRLGIGVVNPYARHPGILAASIATVDNLSGGRAELGIGSSIPRYLRYIGSELTKPVQRCRETVEIIKNLLAERTVNFRGKIFKMNDAELTFEVTRHIPILVGTSGGPKMLQMSGEVADGIIIPGGTRSFYEYAIKLFKKGLSSRGRRLDEVKVIVNGNVAVSDDRDKAIDSIRPLVADSIYHRAVNPFSLRVLGISKEQAVMWKDRPETLPNEVVEQAAICGTPQDCLEGIERFKKLGIDEIVLRFPPEQVVIEVGERIVPRL